MKAWTLNKPAPVSEHPLHLSERALPTPSDDQLLLRVAACGICRTDLHVVEGDLPVRRSSVIPGHQIVGSVAACGSRVEGFDIGDRVGVAWLNRTCGVCEFCVAGRENLCDEAMFTGWTVDGGYAEYAAADSRYCFPLPDMYANASGAPLLCAGLIGRLVLVL